MSQWQYQTDRQREQSREWHRMHKERMRQYKQMYRATHPRENQQQTLKDWQTFKERHPERWREINRAAVRKYGIKHKAEHLEADRCRRARYKAERIEAQKGIKEAYHE